MYKMRRKNPVGFRGDTSRLGGGLLRPWRHLPLDALFWTLGLLAMATMNPEGEHLISLCPLDALGASFCPGCGLGHAVAYLARGELVASMQAHPLGIPAVLILGGHVARLLRLNPLINAHVCSS